MELRCSRCRLVWEEDRRQGDSPVSAWAFSCPRCGHLGEQTPEALQDAAEAAS